MGHRTVRLAATQFHCTACSEDNERKAEAHVRLAAAAGAHVVLLQELFSSLYFCQEQDNAHLKLSAPARANPVIARFAKLAAELGIVLAVPFFERAGTVVFNSTAVVDADGTCLGVYRKSHIPTGPGYEEKFYFSPGDTGFRVFNTKFGRIGVAICWDQWFPEAARALVLQGAEVILYPTAIGSEPHDPTISSYLHWCRTMQGHAAANLVPVVVSNRVGTEQLGGTSITFYGGSFICGPDGGIVCQVGVGPDHELHGNPHPEPGLEEGYCVAPFDLEACAAKRSAWGVFRDRRPDLYGPLLTLDGGQARNP